jgi:hypothetical protein
MQSIWPLQYICSSISPHQYLGKQLLGFRMYAHETPNQKNADDIPFRPGLLPLKLYISSGVSSQEITFFGMPEHPLYPLQESNSARQLVQTRYS